MPINIPPAILRRNPIQRVAHVLAHVVVVVLVEAERAARVLDEQVQQADLVGAQLGQLGLDERRDEVRAARLRRQ